jgi:hypothetical protein
MAPVNSPALRLLWRRILPQRLPTRKGQSSKAQSLSQYQQCGKVWLRTMCKAERPDQHFTM